MTDNQTIEQRKQHAYHFLAKHKERILVSLILLLIILSGSYMRTRNLPQLVDVTTGLHMPMEPDSFAFLRYSRHILEHGDIMDFDPYRYHPNGYYPASEFSFLSSVIVWLYKFLHTFNSDITLEFTQVIYPVLAFAAGLVFFFLLVRRLFSDNRIALLSIAFLSVIPPYLHRTMAGFADKESLGMAFFFLALYLFIAAIQNTSLKKGALLSIGSGLTTALMGLAWGGVQFLFLIIGFFALFEVVFERFKNKDYYLFFLWFLSTFFFLLTLFETRFTFASIFYSNSTLPMLLALFVGFFRILLLRYPQSSLRALEGKLPIGIFAAICSSIFLFSLDILTRGWNTFFYHLNDIISSAGSTLFGASRWGRTVAESHQPFVRDWFSQFGNLYFWLFLLGLILFVYTTFTLSRRYRIGSTAFFVIFMISFLLSRYSSNPPFNGETALSKFLFFGSLFFLAISFLIFYLYAYRKNKELYSKLLQLNKEHIFVLLWVIVLFISARLAIRMLIALAPLTAIFVAYLFVKSYDALFLTNHKAFRIIGILAILFLLFSPTVQGSLTSLYNQSLQTVRYSGTSYNQQWQFAMQWTRDNTPENAVFAHWWDYGYYVQTGGERATLTDGGNNGGPALNFFMGRNVLTGQNNTDALEFLKAKEATHLLIVSDEIGKYPAFSSIGSNLTYDRLSTIPLFTIDPSQTVEQRNQTLLVFKGNAPFEEDFVYQQKIYPAKSSGITHIILPIQTHNNQIAVRQPQASVYHNQQQTLIPLQCVFVDNKEIVFGSDGIPGCFQIIPVIQDNQMHFLKAGLYLHGRVWNTLLTHLYLFGQNWEGFTLAYSDQEAIPLGLYNGRLFGPLKIWNITYHPSIPDNPHYKDLSLDPSLMNI